MGYKAAIQVLRQADDLKTKLLRKCDLLHEADAWTDQQKLQTIYHQALVLDLEYALDKKVEQDLWNIAFKSYISTLQEQARDKKNSRRSDYQALLTWCLESASGFYLTLLQELCNTFDIDIPFRRRGTVYGQIVSVVDQINIPQVSSCLYICQYCLVHLGDIARYRNQRKQAESFYKQAILVSPTSGHPYNQLALLEASQGDKLSTVYYYIRAIAVKNPFPASATNLISILSSAIDKESHCEKIQTKLTVSEFIQLFLCTHGYLLTATDLQQAEVGVKSLNSIMTALVATQSFTKENLIKLTIINLYALQHVTGSKPLKTDELTEDELKVRELVLELIAGSLSAFLVPVHTLKMDETLLDYYALPAVKLLMYFIQNKSDLLKETVFSNRLQIWPSLCKFLNNVQKFLKALNYNKYTKTPLPEDKCLQGFLHFSKNFKEFDFKDEVEDIKIERLIRIKRIVNFSLWLTSLDVNGSKLMIQNEINGEINFEPGSSQPDPTNDLLEAMKSFSVAENNLLDYSKIKIIGSEKRVGILKPQGSLEKSREERELLSSNETTPKPELNNLTILNSNTANKSETIKIKRPKQNVALQSIYKKMEENKQVKFRMEEPSDKEKSVKFDAKPIQKAPPQNQQFNIPPRTQSFNQNHPAFPVPPPNQDYLNLNTLRNPPNLEKPPNYDFPNINTQIPPPNAYQTMPLPPPTQQQQNLPLKNTLQPQNYASQNSYNPQLSGPYQNMSFPSSHPFNAWKRDEIPPPPSWWQNASQLPPQPPSQQQNYQRPDGFSVNYPQFGGGGNNLSYMQHQQKPPPEFTKNGGDVFHSPWGNFPRGNFMGETSGGLNFDSGQNMSMRQAMLKEANIPGASGRMHNAPPGPGPAAEKFLQNPAQNSPGYSLFNTNSWTPNLVGQLRNNKNSTPDNSMGHMTPQSLFGGHGPQSLAQLIEQQNQLQKNDL